MGVRQHGAPEALVTDNGSVFLAKEARRIYQALGIEKREIDRGRPWQNYIEANFGTMRRMADYHFARATAWPELHAVHARFFRDYNGQKHFAHEQRTDGRHSPAHVLGFVHGAWRDLADLDRLFRVRGRRRVDPSGFVRFRNWRFYSERGLAGAEAAVWTLRGDADRRVRDRDSRAVHGGLRAGRAPHPRRRRAAPLRDPLPLAPAVPRPARRAPLATSDPPAALSRAATPAGGGGASAAVLAG